MMQRSMGGWENSRSTCSGSANSGEVLGQKHCVWGNAVGCDGFSSYPGISLTTLKHQSQLGWRLCRLTPWLRIWVQSSLEVLSVVGRQTHANSVGASALKIALWLWQHGQLFWLGTQVQSRLSCQLCCYFQCTNREQKQVWRFKV